jgi:hypothetical protein
MSFSPGRNHPFAPETTPADRRVAGHAAEGHWPLHSPHDSAGILLSQSVARISDAELQRMDRNDLIDLARCASSVLPQEGYLRHLPYMTRDQLQRLACLARRSCRLQQRSGVPLE